MIKNSLMSVLILLVSITIISCSNTEQNKPDNTLEKKMNDIAENYVKLVLKVGKIDPGYVDAYYGPKEWEPSDSENIIKNDSTLKQFSNEADNLLDQLDSLKNYKADNLLTLRFRFLYKQLLAVKARIFLLEGGKLDFDKESKALYDAVAPHFDNQHFQNIIYKIDKLLPGKGSIEKRLNEFQSQFNIPKSKLDTVLKATIEECRKRTLQHIQLPKNENFVVEFVNDKPWGGYNWYKGNSYSVIQINTDLPISVERIIDLAAHEGYPGHHVYNTLLESKLVKNRGWMEFTVYPLYSPQSLIAEGTANFGINMAFPGDSRIKFEKEVLFPLAGLDTSKADEYFNLIELLGKLNYAGNEAARNYLNGNWTKEQTLEWLEKYNLYSPEKAKKSLSFIEHYRSYVINYNLGQDIVKNFIETNGGTLDHPEKRWEIFKYLLSTPQTPSGLMDAKMQKIE